MQIAQYNLADAVNAENKTEFGKQDRNWGLAKHAKPREWLSPGQRPIRVTANFLGAATVQIFNNFQVFFSLFLLFISHLAN